MSLINLSILLSLAAIGIVGFSKILTEKKRLFYSTVILQVIAIFSYSNSLSAIAATDLAVLGANENTQTQEPQIEEDLKLTPGGGHYSGVEYTDRTTKAEKAVSDDSIKESIKAYTSDGVVVAVTNGSVRFSKKS